jgi:hypothetical protein
MGIPIIGIKIYRIDRYFKKWRVFTNISKL